MENEKIVDCVIISFLEIRMAARKYVSRVGVTIRNQCLTWNGLICAEDADRTNFPKKAVDEAILFFNKTNIPSNISNSIGN